MLMLDLSERKCLHVFMRMAVSVSHGRAATGIGEQAAVDGIIVGMIGDDEHASFRPGGATEKQNYDASRGCAKTHGTPNTTRPTQGNTRLPVPASDHATAGLNFL